MTKSYDVIVVGSGIAGLIGGGLLAVNGKKVLLLEKESRVGGYFSGYETEEGDKIDYAVSYVLSCGTEDVVYKVLEKLGLQERVIFKKLEVSDQVYLPEHQILFKHGKENFLHTLISQFPHEKENLQKFAEWLTAFQDGTKVMGKEANLFFVKYFKKTYQEFIDESFTDEKLKGILSLRIQADPSSLMIMAGFITECYYNGMYYPMGGAQNLSNTLAECIRQNGGDVLTGSEVVGFGTMNDTVNEVRTKDGQAYGCRYVLYNGDIYKLYRDYIGLNNIKENVWNRVLSRKVGHSSLNIYLVVEGLDVSRFLGGRVYLSDSYDIFGIYQRIENGEIPEDLVIKLHVPTLHDPGLSAKGRHILRIETDLYHVCDEMHTQGAYHAVADKMLQKVSERLLPGLDQCIKHKRIITPIDYEEKFLHTFGSGTGWAHTVDNSILSTFKQDTPFRNLFIAGQWGEFSSGLRQIVLSGEKSANLILRSDK